jgi:pimeloyl-ACP methyl ester carboxylesterase
MGSSTTVIFIHGLWMSGFALRTLQRRVGAALSCRTASFSYPSVTSSMSEHVRRLIELARAQQTEQLHFVGHSLGGIVIMRALAVTDDLPPGRAVLLGSPLQGSVAATGVARMPLGKALLGSSINEEVLAGKPRVWSGRREVGVIAGSLGVGLGRLVSKLQTEHDGTVLVEETRLPGAKDHIVVPISHVGMLLSTTVAEQAAHFLREGSFRR